MTRFALVCAACVSACLSLSRDCSAQTDLPPKGGIKITQSVSGAALWEATPVGIPQTTSGTSG
jgi:hypothetical protein